MGSVWIVSERVLEPFGKVKEFEIALGSETEAFKQASYMLGKDKTGYEFSEGEDGVQVWAGSRDGCLHVVKIRSLAVYGEWQEL